jgi:hypothetical protein
MLVRRKVHADKMVRLMRAKTELVKRHQTRHAAYWRGFVRALAPVDAFVTG